MWYCLEHGNDKCWMEIREWTKRNDTPYLTLTGKLWSVFCEYFGEKNDDDIRFDWVFLVISDTAYCKNPHLHKWFKFDDHEVYELSRSDVKVSLRGDEDLE